VVTRVYTTACILLTLATNGELISQYQIYLNPYLVVERHEYWRLLTSFMYAGPIGFGMVFNLLFTYRYFRILEESSFRGSSADFCFMLVCMWFIILSMAVWFGGVIFLCSTFTHAILYIWCRRNPRQHVIVFGLLVVKADFVPLVLIGLSMMTGSPLLSDLVAFGAGHLYYFLSDVFPRQPLGFRILRTPHFLKVLFNEEEIRTFENGPPGVDNNLANARMPEAAAAPPLVNDINPNAFQL